MKEGMKEGKLYNVEVYYKREFDELQSIGKKKLE